MPDTQFGVANGFREGIDNHMVVILTSRHSTGQDPVGLADEIRAMYPGRLLSILRSHIQSKYNRDWYDDDDKSTTITIDTTTDDDDQSTMPSYCV